MIKHYFFKTSLTCFAAGILFSCAQPSSTSSQVATSTKKASTSSAKKWTSSFYPAPVSSQVREKAAGFSKDKYGMPTYPVSVRRRYARATAYSHKENEPGAPGRKNAAGTTLKYGRTIRSAAADWSRYPLGTKFKIKGLPHTYVVDDYGSALVGTNTVDIFHPSLRLMNKWNTRKIELEIVQWGDWHRSRKILAGRTHAKHCRRMYYALKKRIANGKIASN